MAADSPTAVYRVNNPDNDTFFKRRIPGGRDDRSRRVGDKATSSPERRECVAGRMTSILTPDATLPSICMCSAGTICSVTPMIDDSARHPLRRWRLGTQRRRRSLRFARPCGQRGRPSNDFHAQDDSAAGGCGGGADLSIGPCFVSYAPRSIDGVNDVHERLIFRVVTVR
jgi:hypothetical protein